MSRWTVTYTKHVKQKRKVYQDGVLELSSSGDKLSLYDECEKLIDSRFLKKDEVVECGGMLAFETHLVDIGDPEVSCISVADQSAGSEEGKLKETAGAQRQKYLPPFNLGNKNIKLQSLPSMNCPNNLHGNIRENKKSTMLNKSAKNLPDSNSIPSNDRVREWTEHCSNEHPQLYPNETHKTLLKEWAALYTTQITQKSKKYHDGILRLVSCSSNSHQVILLNEYETVLSTEYVKSLECVETGHNYKFSNYLVQICEPRFHPREQFPESNNADDSRFGDNIAKAIYDEWDVLYTSQITQKAKKYHDGILRLVNCASHLKQVVLLNEDGTVLSSKYLKSTECVKTGLTCQFPNYLVEICAWRTHLEDDIPHEFISKEERSRSTNTANFTKRKDYRNKPFPKDIQKDDSKKVTDDVRFDSGMANSLNNRRIRDASQILSSLKRPVNLSRSSNIILPDTESKSKIVEVDISISLDPIKSTGDNHGGSEGVIGNYCHESSSNKYSISSNHLSGVWAPDVFPTEFDMEDTDIKSGCIMSSSESREVSDSNACTFPKFIRTNSSLPLGERFSCTPVDKLDTCSSSSSSSPEDNIVADKNRSISDEIVALQQEWASLSNQVSKIGNTETTTSLLQDLPLPNERSETNHPLAASSPVSVVIEATSNNSESESISKTCLNVDECPTFDLGFD